MNILGLTKTTLLDYPGRVACTIFVGGCNYLCPFCHNRDIVFQSGNISRIDIEEVIGFLRKRKNILQGVCVTGGEPTLNSGLPDFLYRVKELGYDIKLDTNGTNPKMVNDLIESQLIDYCAMDIKNSPEKYAKTCGFGNSPDLIFDIDSIRESVSLLMTRTRIPYEFRTTVVRELHDENDMVAIAKWIAGAGSYYIQSYQDCPQVIRQGYHGYSKDELEFFVKICREYVPATELRGVE